MLLKFIINLSNTFYIYYIYVWDIYMKRLLLLSLNFIMYFHTDLILKIMHSCNNKK